MRSINAQDPKGGTRRFPSKVGLLVEVIGLKATLRFEPGRGWEVPINILSNQRIREALGWRPMVSLRDGLVEMYKALKSE